MQTPTKISHFIVPPSGWKFQNGNFWIYGDTFDELVKNVQLHRERNGFFVGDVVSEIENQLLRNNPGFVV